MSLYRRKKVWYIQLTTPNGSRIQKSTGTTIKEDALKVHDQLKKEIWRVTHFGTKPTYYWEDAVVNWLDTRYEKKSLETDKSHFRLLDPYLFGKRLVDIDKKVIDQFVKDRKAKKKKSATIDRTLSLLNAVLNQAKKDEWIDKVPSITFFKPDNAIVRFLTQDEAAKLLQNSPEWLADLIVFSLGTGLREGNVLQLQWRCVNLSLKQAWVEKKTAKGVVAIPIPLNDDAWDVIIKQIGKHSEYVFSLEGEPIKKAGGTEWQKALKRANIKNFRWHDLRHTWASWHVQAGTPLPDLMKLGGWSTMDMVLRYAHLRTDDLAKHKNNILISALTKKRNEVSTSDVSITDIRLSGFLGKRLENNISKHLPDQTSNSLARSVSANRNKVIPLFPNM